MAFLRTAHAMVVHPKTTPQGWSRIRTAKLAGQPSPNLVTQASEILGQSFDPNRYLLTHCTIVASVDVEVVPGVKLGSVNESGKKINRKYADFRVSTETDQYINNNLDCFDRKVLLKSYRTFIGGHNFVEHVQVEDLSKGRIIDAVARDIGDTIYIDILVATDRKHTDLVASIESGEMGTLSMGCFLPGTMVTMSDGTRIPIEDIQPGDKVLSHKGRAQEVLNKQIRGGKWNMRRLQVQGVPSDIVSTDNHPFFVYRPMQHCGCGCGEMLLASDAKSKPITTRTMGRRFLRGHDKRIYNPNNTYSLEEHRRRKDLIQDIKGYRVEEIRADEIQVGDYVFFPRTKSVSLGEEGKARLLGYFLAEGSFIKYKGVPSEVQFNFSMGEKDTFVSEVVALLKQEFPNCTPWVQERVERNTCVVHVSGKEIAQWFKHHGGEYSFGKRISPEVMGWSNEAHKHLIGAWINGDGTLGKGGATSGTTTSYNLACQIQMLMAGCGIHSRMECGIQGIAQDIRNVINGGFVVRDEATGKLPALTLTLGQTDAQPLQGYCSKIRNNPTHNQRSLRLNDEAILYQVTSNTSEEYEGWVYDMEISEDHSYIVEGVAVHNCSVETTTCTKCGNVAVDETDMCECVRYAKGNMFLDERGKRHRVAELCGHESLDPTGGVTFIEASWVATPAFTGAVLRNIISPDTISAKTAQRIQEVLSKPPEHWVVDGQRKAASEGAVVGRVSDRKLAFDFGEDAPAEEAPAADAPKQDGFEGIEDRVMQVVYDRIERRVKDELDKKPQISPEESSAAPNDTLVKEASRKASRNAYEASVKAMVRMASSNADLLNKVAVLDEQFGVKASVNVYRTVLSTGPVSKYGSVEGFLKVCRDILGRNPTQSESRALVRLGHILSFANQPENKYRSLR